MYLSVLLPIFHHHVHHIWSNFNFSIYYCQNYYEATVHIENSICVFFWVYAKAGMILGGGLLLVTWPNLAASLGGQWETFLAPSFPCLVRHCCPKELLDTVDGWNYAPVEVGSLSHYLQGFLHPRWCRISSINSIFMWSVMCWMKCTPKIHDELAWLRY